MAKILLVDDDNDIAENILIWLRKDGHTVEHAADGHEASFRLSHYSYEIIILDLDLPKKDGLTVCREFRQNGGKTPIIMLTGKGASMNKVVGLDAGADDYVPKPFSLNELSARIRAILRRSSGSTTNVATLGDLNIDFSTKLVHLGQSELKLRPKEYSLLSFMVRHPNEIFSTESLLARVWSSDSDSSLEAVRSCLRIVRQQLSSIPNSNVEIETVHSEGYRLRLKPQLQAPEN